MSNSAENGAFIPSTIKKAGNYMSKQIVIKQEGGDADLMVALKSSLYPGASDESVNLVLAYCRAARLDPMQKPVHIVSMWDSTARVMRDVVMPGIGLYRIQAARTGEYAGVTNPAFGDDVSKELGGVTVTYPLTCTVTVRRRMSDGMIAEFSATERWIENYATKSKDTAAPNSMWQRRPYGQLAKCAEAQALRKAFPEVGNLPTAEEMEGKTYGAVIQDIPAQQESAVTRLLESESVNEAKSRFRIAWKDHPDQRDALTSALNQRLAELTTPAEQSGGESDESQSGGEHDDSAT